MTRTAALATILCLFGQSIQAQSIPYVSPGFSISVTLEGKVVWIPKISVGVVNEEGVFVNLTLGVCSGDTSLGAYTFAEVQAGGITKPSGTKKSQIFIGGGVGATFLREKSDTPIAPRASASLGYLIFLNIDATYSKELHMDFGGQAVLPIPLKKPDLQFGD